MLPTFRKALLAGSCAGALLASPLLASPGFAAAAPDRPVPPPAERAHVWAQSYSDLPADPAIRFGTLPNGMRYAVMHNDTPKGQTAIRLRIGAGSLDESDAEQGLAHVLEHMAFKGSIHAPDGQIVKDLERRGLSFGGDTNAETEQTQTVYQLDLPESDPQTLGLGLDFMRDVCSGLLLEPKALQAERGVVLSEERLRDTPDYESYKARLQFQLKGQRVAERLPIGQVEVIEHAPASLVRSFYEANYRPENAVLVVVGDIDPDAVVAKIRAEFGDWRATTPAPAPIDLGQPLKRGRSFQLVVRKGVEPTLDLGWASPPDLEPDGAARERREFVETIAFAALNRRLARLSHAPDPPFLSSVSGRSDVAHSARLSLVQTTFRAGEWRRALDATVAAVRQARQYGFSQAEVDRELTEQNVAFENAAQSAATRRSPALADEVVRTVDDEEVDTSPAEDLKLIRSYSEGLTAAEVDKAFDAALSGDGPLVSLVTPDPVSGGEGALAAAFTADAAAPVAPPAAQAAIAWTHTRFGAPGRVVQTRTAPDLGVTFVRFANGVRLTFKPTTFAKDQALVAVNFGRGRLGEPKDRQVPDWALSGFIGGGLSDLNYEDLQQALLGRTVTAGLGIEDDSYRLSGATRTADLATQLQLLAAYMTAPGWRPEAFARVKGLMGVGLAQLAATPEGVEARDRPALIHDGDQRWAYPDPTEVKDATLPELKALLDPELKGGPLEVVIVGDVTLKEAEAAVASTFGALPARAPLPVPAGGDQVAFPAGGGAPVAREDHGRPDQGAAYVGWAGPDLLSDLTRARRVNLAGAVLQLRLTDRIRIAEGASYSPAGGAYESDVFPGYGYLYASVETPPDKIATFYADVDDITRDMAERGITADELARAERPRVEGIEKAQQTNGYWATMLHDADEDPRRLDLIRTSVSGYKDITPADVQATARTYLEPAHAWRFQVTPPEPVAAPPGAGALPPRKVKPLAPGPVLRTPGEPSPSPSAAPPTTPAAAH